MTQQNNLSPMFVGNVSELCAFLRTSRSTLYRWLKDNPEKYRRVGRTIFLLTL